MRRVVSVLLLCIMAVILIMMAQEMPAFGEPGKRGSNSVYTRYITQGLNDTGASNLVTAVVLDYRGFDTMGETTVLFTAIMASLLALSFSENGKSHHGGD